MDRFLDRIRDLLFEQSTGERERGERGGRRGGKEREGADRERGGGGGRRIKHVRGTTADKRTIMPGF